MPSQFDFVTTSDHPALLVIDNPEILSQAKTSLLELNYKVHNIETHEEFPTRYSEIPYEVLIIDELFGGFGGMAENYTLYYFQQMPMTQRRHTIALLLGNSYETLNSMQAFSLSVHAVVNYSELALLPQLVQKAVADNDMFLQIYRETTKRVVQMRLSGQFHR